MKSDFDTFKNTTVNTTDFNTFKNTTVNTTDFNTFKNTTVNTTDFNNLITGKTPLQNTKITGTLTTDSLVILNTITPASTTPASTTPASTTPASTTPASTTPPAPNTTLSIGDSLNIIFTGLSSDDKTGSREPYRNSPNGMYRLYLQTDGNLVLYNTTNTPYTTVWSAGVRLYTSNIPSNSTISLNFQNDGDLVLNLTSYNTFLFRNETVAQWRTSTGGQGASRFAVRDDGKIVITNSTGAILWSKP